MPEYSICKVCKIRKLIKMLENDKCVDIVLCMKMKQILDNLEKP